MRPVFICEFTGYLFTIRRVDMGEKERIADFASAVIIPVVQLALNGNIGAEAHAAFPTPVTCKLCHCQSEYCPGGKNWLRHIILYPAPVVIVQQLVRDQTILIFQKYRNIKTAHHIPEQV